MSTRTTTQEREWVRRMGTWGTRALIVVTALALVFTMVNVQRFAANNDPHSWWWWSIAWLLDPMATLTAVTAIAFEVFLADHYRPRVGWLTATKWYALGCTWIMNVWSSVAALDSAGVLLHSVAPGLILLLAEAAPRVRRHVAGITTDLPHPEQERIDALTPHTALIKPHTPQPDASPSPVSPAGSAALLTRARTLRATRVQEHKPMNRDVLRTHLKNPDGTPISDRVARQLIAALNREDTPTLTALPGGTR